MPIELVEKKPRVSRPIHLVAKDGLPGAGLDASTLTWARATGFNGETGRSLLVSAPGGEVAAALFGLGNVNEQSALGAGALAKALPEGNWHFANAPGQSDACDAWRRAGRLRLLPLRQEAGQGHPPDRARRRGCSLYQAHCGGRVPGARPRQHADQRHGTRRTRTGRARAGAQAQGKSLGGQGRRSAGEEFSDDPCGRPCLRQGAASDRSGLGRQERAEGYACRQGRLFRHRRSRHQAVQQHALDEEGHGRRGKRAWPCIDDHGVGAEGQAAGADPGGRKRHIRQCLPAGRRAEEPQGIDGRDWQYRRRGPAGPGRCAGACRRRDARDPGRHGNVDGCGARRAWP